MYDSVKHKESRSRCHFGSLLITACSIRTPLLITRIHTFPCSDGDDVITTLPQWQPSFQNTVVGPLPWDIILFYCLGCTRSLQSHVHKPRSFTSSFPEIFIIILLFYGRHLGVLANDHHIRSMQQRDY